MILEIAKHTSFLKIEKISEELAKEKCLPYLRRVENERELSARDGFGYISEHFLSF